MTETAPLYVRVKDVQDRFGIHRTTLYRAARRGEIVIHRRGYLSFVKVSDMEAWIEGTADAGAA